MTLDVGYLERISDRLNDPSQYWRRRYELTLDRIVQLRARIAELENRNCLPISTLTPPVSIRPLVDTRVISGIDESKGFDVRFTRIRR